MIPGPARNPLLVSPNTFTGYPQYHYRVYGRAGILPIRSFARRPRVTMCGGEELRAQ